MPKKTKRQKIRADERKKHVQMPSASKNLPFSSKIRVEEKNIETTVSSPSFIARDLKKTLIIALVLFTLEFIVLYAKLIRVN